MPANSQTENVQPSFSFDIAGPPGLVKVKVEFQLAQVQYRITKVIVRGYRRVPSSTLRKSISIHPGDTYDPAQIEREVAALKNTGYFEDVRAETKDDAWKSGKMVTFTVREKKDLVVPNTP